MQHMKSLCNTFHVGSLYKNQASNKGMKRKGENVSSSLAGLMNCWGTHSTHMTDQKRTPKGPSGLSSLANSAMHTHTTTLQGIILLALYKLYFFFATMYIKIFFATLWRTLGQNFRKFSTLRCLRILVASTATLCKGTFDISAESKQ
jgi:hypothetical protein